MLRTLIDLFTQPARMAAEYVYGRRVTFFAPFQLLFLTATLYMIIYFWSGESSDFEIGNSFSNMLTPAVNTFCTKLIRFFQNNRGIMWVLCIPLQVLVFRMLYKEIRYRFTWVETCFIAAYFFSQIIIIELIFVLFNAFFPSYAINDSYLMLSYLFFLSYDMKELTGGTWKKNIFKCIFGQFLFFTVLGFIALFVTITGFIIYGLLKQQESLAFLM